jgi:hypothetical protein
MGLPELFPSLLGPGRAWKMRARVGLGSGSGFLLRACDFCGPGCLCSKIVLDLGVLCSKIGLGLGVRPAGLAQNSGPRGLRVLGYAVIAQSPQVGLGSGPYPSLHIRCTFNCLQWSIVFGRNVIPPCRLWSRAGDDLEPHKLAEPGP